jgi:hypothetical protein
VLLVQPRVLELVLGEMLVLLEVKPAVLQLQPWVLELVLGQMQPGVVE